MHHTPHRFVYFDGGIWFIWHLTKDNIIPQFFCSSSQVTAGDNCHSKSDNCEFWGCTIVKGFIVAVFFLHSDRAHVLEISLGCFSSSVMFHLHDVCLWHLGEMERSWGERARLESLLRSRRPKLMYPRKAEITFWGLETKSQLWHTRASPMKPGWAAHYRVETSLGLDDRKLDLTKMHLVNSPGEKCQTALTQERN